MLTRDFPRLTYNALDSGTRLSMGSNVDPKNGLESVNTHGRTLP